MKRYFKKTLSILLVVTSFNFLSTIDKASCNILTYANTEVSSVTELNSSPKINKYRKQNKPKRKKTRIKGETKQRKDIEIVTFEDKEYIHYIDTLFYFDKNLKCAYTQSKKRLDKIYQIAKKKIQSNLGLIYPLDLEVPVHVLDLSDKTYDGTFYDSHIEINSSVLFDNETLPHEMIHAFFHHFLGENYKYLNLSLEEGFAAQNNKLSCFGNISTQKNKKHLKNYYPSDNSKNLYFYALSQYIIHDWIVAKGKCAIKKFLERVKNGEDSVKVFLDLGGDKIMKKYNCTIASKFDRFLEDREYRKDLLNNLIFALLYSSEGICIFFSLHLFLRNFFN